MQQFRLEGIFKCRPIPTPLPWAGTPFTTWLWTLPGQPQLFWASRDPHHPHCKKILLYV